MVDGRGEGSAEVIKVLNQHLGEQKVQRSEIEVRKRQMSEQTSLLWRRPQAREWSQLTDRQDSWDLAAMTTGALAVTPRVILGGSV